MHRPFLVTIVACWSVMLALLVWRTAAPSVRSALPLVRDRVAVGEQWMGVYHEGRKIGYTHHDLAADGDGFAFAEESLLRLVVADTPQTVRVRMGGHIGADFGLRDVSFELSSGAGNLQARGVVDGGALHLTVRTGTDVSSSSIPLHEPLQLAATLRASLRPASLQSGQQFEALIFDPVSLKNDRIRLTVEGFEPVPQAAPGVEGWRVREEFRGLKTTAWIDGTGAVLREEGPMGLVLVRQSAADATGAEWANDTALDLVATAAVPVAQPIKNARGRRSLRVRLSGIAVDTVPSDGEQRRDGSVLTISRPEIAVLESYALPYGGGDRADDLSPTAFLQSDHPRLQAVSREALDGERDAKRAAQRLNDFVHAYLRKVPTVSIPNALQVLDMREGDCNEHAVLFAALARAAGLPSRVVAGVVYVDAAFLYHAWCEVWLGRWVPIDPALHQFPADATHIKFVVGGPEEHLAMMSIVGRLAVEVLDETHDASGDRRHRRRVP